MTPQKCREAELKATFSSKKTLTKRRTKRKFQIIEYIFNESAMKEHDKELIAEGRRLQKEEDKCPSCYKEDSLFCSDCALKFCDSAIIEGRIEANRQFAEWLNNLHDEKDIEKCNNPYIKRENVLGWLKYQIREKIRELESSHNIARGNE